MTSISLRICIDVDDIDRGLAFYTTAFGLTVGRRFDTHWVELLGGPSPIDLLGTRAGSKTSPGSEARRDYARHWTPIHLDFVVSNMDEAVERAVSAGAVLERPVRAEPYGKLANLADPFGHGICLLEMNALGYDALLALPRDT